MKALPENKNKLLKRPYEGFLCVCTYCLIGDRKEAGSVCVCVREGKRTRLKINRLEVLGQDMGFT